jgi:hypothetical protein
MLIQRNGVVDIRCVGGRATGTQAERLRQGCCLCWSWGAGKGGPLLARQARTHLAALLSGRSSAPHLPAPPPAPTSA